MEPLNLSQKIRILEAFCALDPLAYAQPIAGHEAEGLYYEGYVTVEALIALAQAVTAILVTTSET